MNLAFILWSKLGQRRFIQVGRNTLILLFLYVISFIEFNTFSQSPFSYFSLSVCHVSRLGEKRLHKADLDSICLLEIKKL